MMGSRAEFTKPTKRDALKRSGFRCEAVGSWYGMPDGVRCAADLRLGVEYDHIILDANSKDNSLENCAAVCPKCHRFKTSKHDTPLAAKTLRQQDKANGIKAKTQTIKSKPFAKKERQSKPSLPPRQLYQTRDA